MSSATHEHDIQKEVKKYLMVFGGLLVFTMVTVLASKLHLELHLAVTLALFIATIKAGLVACYFMHLISERKLVYVILGFTAIFFIGLLSLPLIESIDVIRGTHVVH